MRQGSMMLIALGLLGASAGLAPAGDRVEVVLASDGNPDSGTNGARDDGTRSIGINYHIFSGPDDHAIYYSAADWVRNPDEGFFLDGLVELNFGMNFGNHAEDYPEGFDRQVKHLQEYLLAPGYDAGISAPSLVSATLSFGVDRVIDMTQGGATDLWAPEWMYLVSFAGDGLLTTLADAQLDFDRCDRTAPETWDYTIHLVSPDGYRLSDDEIDANGGLIIFEIDVTEDLRALIGDQESFAGFTMAGSHDGDFTLLSMDGGALPSLTLIGPLLGDFDEDEDVDLADYAWFQRCFTGPDVTAIPECRRCDFERDDDVDLDDYSIFASKLTGPGGGGFRGAERSSRTGTVRIRPGRKGKESISRGEIGDFNADGQVNRDDRAHFQDCFSRRDSNTAPGCENADLDGDGDVDERDLILFRGIFTK